MANPKIQNPKGPRGPMSGMMPGDKPKNFKATMRTLAAYLRPFRLRLLIATVAAILSVVFSVVAPMILGRATDVIADSVITSSPLDFNALGYILILLVVLYGISTIFSGLMGFIMAGISQKISYQLRKELSEKIDRLPLKYFDTRTQGELLSRVTNDVDTINSTLNQSLAQILTSAITIVGILSLMIYINPFMTLVALVTLPLSFIVVKQVVKKSQGHFKDNQRFLGEVNGHIEEMFSGHVIVKAFNGEPQSKETFESWNQQLAKAGEKSQFISGTMMPLTSLIGNIGFVLICVVGGYLAFNGRVSIGNIQAFLQYIRTFNQPISQLANVVNVLQSTAAAAERVFELLAEDEEVPDQDLLPFPCLDQIRGEITFDHVKFAYPQNQASQEKLLIKDFTFLAKPGQRIAIVGPTGAGKTTIVKLLLRFYELNGGRILLDGVDIKRYSRQDLRSAFGMVLQDNWLFSGTVSDNIRYGCINASDEEIERAAKAAHIDHYIKTQPGGYHMEIQEDASNLSQGQKQLLTMARAFLASSPVLILDEATSSVDTRTEVQIQKAMADLMKDKTSFVIAHRLSTIRDADVILVMKEGDIVEQGSHQELLAQKGFYKTLYESQYE
ncbi:MAG: ABC transporter ATP-binding protein [Anaerovoracaceae bacterium]|nr:ABC transporter ATP-binding protein [Anaerovoracaceae bacterium]